MKGRTLQSYDNLLKLHFNLSQEVKGSGNKILFRGFDNPDSITSITVDVGSLCWVWVEEAYQVDDEEAFNKLDMSIRGAEIEQGGLFPQITLTLNPWSEMWIKTRFFDKQSDDILAITRNYYHNEFLSEADYKLFHQMREEDPERYRVEGEGDWGIPGGRYFPEWQPRYHIYDDIEIQPHWRRYVAFDYGLDMLACYWIAVERNDRLYVYKELCQSNLVITDAIARIKEINNGEEIYQWVAPPDMWNRRQETGKSIADWFAEYGIPLTKASNNRIQGWLNMKEYLKIAPDEQGILSPMLKVSRACTELIRCIPRLTIDEKNPNDVATEPHDITHAPDAIRYFLAARPLSIRITDKPQQYQFEFERRRASAINQERSVTPI